MARRDDSVFEDETRPAHERAKALLEAVDGRKELKRLGAWLQAQPESLRAAVRDEGNRRGADLPDEAIGWPGKKLLRRALAREEAARVRTNPIARDESFTCEYCGREVVQAVSTARDHCPYCLCSKHVDVVPGDRDETCHGQLKPVEVYSKDGRWMIRYRCARCGAERHNKALLDVEPPDDWDLLVKLSAKASR